MHKPVQRDPRKPYAPPKLSIYGTVKQLTKKMGLRHTRDGGGLPRIKTAI
jgi:hypothetical protein